MNFRFGLLADYAGRAERGKLLIVGIFDTVFARLPDRPISLPDFYLVGEFDAFAVEGSEHRLEIHVTNADGADVAPPGTAQLRFVTQGPGRPLRAQVLVRFLSLSVPETGDYAFRLLIDGRQEGSVPFYVLPAPPAE